MYYKSVTLFSGLYEVSPDGNIRVTPGRIAPTPLFSPSYEPKPRVTLYLRSRSASGYRPKTLPIKEVVAKAFVHNPRPTVFTSVRCLDGDEKNVKVENLVWCSPRDAAAASRSAGKGTKPSGWRGSSRTLPDGTVFKRNPKCIPVVQYKAEPHRRTVRRGDVIRIWPSALHASKSTGCPAGAIRNCCDYWMHEDMSFVDPKYSPDFMLKRTRTVRPSNGRGMFCFAWSSFKDRRAHPLAFVFDNKTTLFYERAIDAVEHLSTPYDEPDTFAREIASAAARSPMYDSPEASQYERWPEITTRKGTCNVFYI